MALGTQTQGKLLDFEQYIDHQLGQTRARIKMTDVLTAGMILVASALGVLFLEVVLDHIFGLPLIVRQFILVVGLATAGTFAAMRIARPLLRRVNGLYAAKTIEDVDPTFKNSLLNYLDLRRRRKEMPRAVMAAVEAKAVSDLSKVQIDTVVNQQRLVRAVYTLCGVIVVFCIYAWSTPKSIMDSTRRALLADVVRPTNTTLVNIKPGDDEKASTVVAGARVTFSTEVHGVRPSRVLLNYSVDGGRFYAKRELTRGKRDYDPWETTFDAQQTVDYYLTGGDAESRHYKLKVLPAPMVVSITHDLKFPDYTGFPPREGAEGGNVEAIEGTLVTVHARTNQPAESGSLELGPLGSKWMTPSSSDATLLEGQFRVVKTGKYHVAFKTTGGQVNPNPVVHDITALPDRAPTAEFIQPTKDITAPSNGHVALYMKAEDDFGIKDATLHVRQGNEILRAARNYLEKRKPERTWNQQDVLDLAALRVKPGSTIEYWLTVRDTKEPQTNRVETAHQKITVGDPVSKDELKKLDEQAKQDVPPPEPPPQPEDQVDSETSPEASKGEQTANENNKDAPPKDQNPPPAENEKPEPQDQQDQKGPQQDQKWSQEDMNKLRSLEKALGMQKQQPSKSAGGEQNAPNNSAKPQDGQKQNPNDNKQVGRNSRPNAGGNTPPAANAPPSRSDGTPPQSSPDNAAPNGAQGKKQPSPVSRNAPDNGGDSSNPPQSDQPQTGDNTQKPGDAQKNDGRGSQSSPNRQPGMKNPNQKPQTSRQGANSDPSGAGEDAAPNNADQTGKKPNDDPTKPSGDQSNSSQSRAGTNAQE
jgi:hypothetical protein